MENDKLARPNHALTEAKKLSLTVSQQTLGVQLHLTVLNSKTEPNPELAAEFSRAFRDEPPQALEYAFRRWRDDSPFFPAVSDIRQYVKTWHRERREEERLRREQEERAATELARAAGKLLGWDEVLRRFEEISTRRENRLPSVRLPFSAQMESLAGCVQTLGTTDEEIASRRVAQTRPDLTPEQWQARRQEAERQAKELCIARGVEPVVHQQTEEDRKQMERDLENARAEIMAEEARFDPKYRNQ